MNLASATNTAVDHLVEICARRTHDVLRSEISIAEEVGATISRIGEKTWSGAHEASAATSVRSIRYAIVVKEVISDRASVELREHYAHSKIIRSCHADVINIGI